MCASEEPLLRTIIQRWCYFLIVFPLTFFYFDIIHTNLQTDVLPIVDSDPVSNPVMSQFVRDCIDQLSSVGFFRVLLWHYHQGPILHHPFVIRCDYYIDLKRSSVVIDWGSWRTLLRGSSIWMSPASASKLSTAASSTGRVLSSEFEWTRTVTPNEVWRDICKSIH